MRMTESLDTIKDRVGSILSKYPETRDSDKLLWLAYMNIFHGMKDVLGKETYKYLKELIMSDSTPTMESIRRVRQKYQENGMFVGENRTERIIEANNVRGWAINTNLK